MIDNTDITNYSDSIDGFNIHIINNLNFNSIQFSKRKWHTFFYVKGGSAVIQIDFDDHIALKDKVFFIDKYKIVNWDKQKNIRGLMVQFTDSFYNIIYTGNPKIRSDQTLLGDFPPFIKLEPGEEDEWNHLMDLIRKEHLQLKENSKEIICLCLKIMVMLYRRKAFLKGRFMITDRKRQLMFEFRKLVNSRYSELKSTKDFAARLNISPGYLNAVCREISNKTVTEIVQERLILEAKRLLVHTDLSVSEISYKLGYKDNSYFGRYFKKAVGIPPERYRNIYYKYYSA